MHRSGERTRRACWRSRPGFANFLWGSGAELLREPEKVRFGATPKPARETRALPGLLAAAQVVEWCLAL